jgi:hypothetical protein
LQTRQSDLVIDIIRNNDHTILHVLQTKSVTQLTHPLTREIRTFIYKAYNTIG